MPDPVSALFVSVTKSHSYIVTDVTKSQVECLVTEDLDDVLMWLTDF